MGKQESDVPVFPKLGDKISHILVIDDEENTRQQLGELIRSKGFSCYEAINIFEALVYLTLYDFDGIIANTDLPFLKSREFVQALHSRLRPPFPPIIALSNLENLTPTPDHNY